MDINATCANHSTMDNSEFDINQIPFNVLLISDETNFLRPLDVFFKSFGGKVSVAFNRENVMLLYCCGREYDLVILDVDSKDDSLLHSAVSLKQLQKIFNKFIPIVGLSLLDCEYKDKSLTKLKEIEQYIDHQYAIFLGHEYHGSYEIMKSKIKEWVKYELK